MLAPVKDTARGIKGYLAGLQWLKAHPKYLVILFIPMMIALGMFFYGWGLFFNYEDQIFSALLFAEPEAWWWLIVYYICKAVLYVGFFLTGLVSFVLIANVLACPLYEWVSVAVEKDVRGGLVDEVSIWESVKLMGEELKKVSFILLMSLVLLFIPVLNIVATLLTAFLVGWDFYDYPLARRGWSFRKRFRFVMGDFWTVMGLGLWLMIPFVQIFLMPMAIAGGTLLSLEKLRMEKQLTVNKEGA